MTERIKTHNLFEVGINKHNFCTPVTQRIKTNTMSNHVLEKRILLRTQKNSPSSVTEGIFVPPTNRTGWIHKCNNDPNHVTSTTPFHNHYRG